MSEYIPITSAEQLVRHLLKRDCSADEIERRLKDDPFWHHAALPEVQACQRLLAQRRRYDSAAAAILAESGYPSAENIAARLRVDERTVRRWRDGQKEP